MNAKRIFGICLAVVTLVICGSEVVAGGVGSLPITAKPTVIVNTDKEQVAPGKFKPTWGSLQRYEIPEWFRDAKFGIWAHWGPQCEPQHGGWYARDIYKEGSGQYKYHVQHYGHPSEFGFKDVIHEWKAEKWNPDQLVKLYKRAGAQYFFAMANHHDNFDLWDSKYQPWNSVAVGPKKNIIAGWASAARKNGLPFGISVHASHAWTWYEFSQMADDANGDKAGVPYDGTLTKADGKGKWWEGLDPQDLYAQNHPLSRGEEHGAGSQWNWGNGASQPDQAYCDKFYNRTMDLINKYHPDLIYFDDWVLPLWPVSDAGLKIAAHFYNTNMTLHNGKLEAILFGKKLDTDEKKALVWDIERGVSATIVTPAWQTCNCIGGWHYNDSIYEHDRYQSAKTIVQMLADIVSKNGNLLLSIPVRGDGSIDDKGENILQGIADWMNINKECIFGTRPWRVFGQGPTRIKKDGTHVRRKLDYTANDVRFTQSKDGRHLYAISLGWPEKNELILDAVKVKGSSGKSKVTLLGYNGSVNYRIDDKSHLVITLPKLSETQRPCKFAYAFRISDFKLDSY